MLPYKKVGKIKTMRMTKTSIHGVTMVRTLGSGLLLFVLSILWLPAFGLADENPKTQQAIIQNQQSYKETGKAVPIIRPTVILYPFSEGTPTFYCALEEACDIAFLPGDRPVIKTIGDSADWRTSWWVGMGQEGPIYHMSFKPRLPNIRTDVIIGTVNNRAYNFFIQAVPSDRLRVHFYSFYDPGSWSQPLMLPAFQNPQAGLQKSQKEISELKEKLQKAKQDSHPHGLYIDPRSIEANYEVKGHAEWKPVSVFDDGIRVFIQFPPSVMQHFRPAFFLVSRSGQLETDLSNRVSNTEIVVPHLFRHGALVWGIGSDRRRVDIIRLEKKNKKPWYDPF